MGHHLAEELIEDKCSAGQKRGCSSFFLLAFPHQKSRGRNYSSWWFLADCWLSHFCRSPNKDQNCCHSCLVEGSKLYVCIRELCPQLCSSQLGLPNQAMTLSSASQTAMSLSTGSRTAGRLPIPSLRSFAGETLMECRLRLLGLHEGG